MEFPDVFGYGDYRAFLQDWFKVHKRQTGRKGTSDFARTAGCSPGHVRNVVVGRRDLQAAFIEGFVRALGLSAEDATCFGLLVRCAHPMSSADRMQAARDLRALQQRHAPAQPQPKRGRPKKVVAQPAQPESVSEHYTEWYHPVIRALACCAGFQDNPTWIAASLRPAISPLQVASFLRQDEGKPAVKPRLPITAPFGDPRAVAYHRQALRTARWALHNGEHERGKFAAATTSLRPEQLKRLQQEIARFEADIEEIFRKAAQPGYREMVRSDDPNPERPDSVELVHAGPNVVYQLTVQVFPLSKRV